MVSDEPLLYRSHAGEVASVLIDQKHLVAGAPQSLDTDHKEFIARYIEQTSTAHGRRHDTVLYSNHKVKKQHFLSLANYMYNLYRKGKELIKPATTVLSRGRPNNILVQGLRRHTVESHRFVQKILLKPSD